MLGVLYQLPVQRKASFISRMYLRRPELRYPWMNTLVSVDALKKEELSRSDVNSSSKIIVSWSSGLDLTAGMVSNKLFFQLVQFFSQLFHQGMPNSLSKSSGPAMTMGLS